MITLQILLLVTGLALIVFGADWLVDGASAVARRAGISEFVIGLTIVGFGTSCPELVVSLTGAFAGNSDISIGNVLGSNIFNTLMILGMTAVVAPIAIEESNRKRDIPINLAVTAMLLVLGMSVTLFGIGASDRLSRAEGALFLAVFCLYMYSCFKNDKDASVPDDNCQDSRDKGTSVAKAVMLILAGLAGLIGGGQLFVNSATDIAKAVGISDKFVAITILAGGTSLPELATCVMAAVKKKGQLALGNILGSNIFNILLILGCSAVVRPISLAGMNMVDMGMLMASIILVLIVALAGKKEQISRFEGAILLIFEFAYMVWLVATL